MPITDGPGVDRPLLPGCPLDKHCGCMWGPSVDHITARFRLIDIVITQQPELIEHHQQACRIAAGVDAIKLVCVEHVFHAGTRHMVCRAGYRTTALVEPRARSRHGLAFGCGRGASWRQKLRKLGAVTCGQVNFNAIFTAEGVADAKTSQGARHRKTPPAVVETAEYSGKAAATTRGLVAPVAIEALAISATQPAT